MAGIEATLHALAAELGDLEQQGRLRDHEVIVVDDASSDATVARVDAFGPPARVVRHDQNRGLGAAIRTGIDAARGDHVLYTDADLPAAPQEIGVALDHLAAEPTLVCAHRSDRRGDGPRRFVYSIVYNRLVRSLLGITVPDVNFAFKLLPTASARALGLCSEGSFIDAEIVARAGRAGMDVVSFAVDYHPRTAGRSTLSSLRVIVGMLRDLQQMRSELVSRQEGRPCGSP